MIRQRLLYAKLVKTESSGCDLILDVGCGAGLFIGTCKRFGKFVVGVDVDRGQLSYAVNYGKGLLVLADASYLPFKDSSVDMVFFSHVIEHLENPFPIFEEIRRVLKNGGVFIVVTPTEHKNFYTPGHVRAYTKKSMSETLARAGFLNVKTVYGHSFLLNIKDSEFFKKVINVMPIRWFREILIAKAINQKIENAQG
ncbi:MAG: class I SAM-dependent methyltransferase [Candidatus Bathyarchaeia archaeon]